jgi:hypothetical protein
MKLILSSLLAAVVCFLWGYFSWTVLGWHQNSVQGFHDEEKLTEMIRKSALAGHGTYVLPFNQEPLKIATVDEKQAMAEAYKTAYTDGPYVRAVVRPGKREVKVSTQMAYSFGRSFLAALMLGGLLSITTIPYLARVLVCAGLGLFASIVAEVPLWIWFESPGRDLAVSMVDHVIEWALGGLVLGAFLGNDPTAAHDRM